MAWAESEIDGDKDFALVIALAKADNRFFRQGAKRAYVIHPFAAKAVRAAAQDAVGDPAQRGGIVQRIALRRLAGDDQAVAQLFRKRQAEIFPDADFSINAAPLRL